VKQSADAGETSSHAWPFWVALAGGWSMIGFGIHGIVDRVGGRTNPFGLARLFIGLNVIHDAVVAPLVIVAGVVLGPVLPRRARPVVQGAVIVSAVVALYAYPLVRGYGRIAESPSVLPLNYGHGLAVVLAAIWAVALVIMAVRWAAARD